MITNREEVLENALRVFAKMNYEKASQVEIGKACGLTKAGLVYYYPIKLDLFVAVIDKYCSGCSRWQTSSGSRGCHPVGNLSNNI